MTVTSQDVKRAPRSVHLGPSAFRYITIGVDLLAAVSQRRGRPSRHWMQKVSASGNCPRIMKTLCPHGR